jgi:hypothetical protein
MMVRQAQRIYRAVAAAACQTAIQENTPQRTLRNVRQRMGPNLTVRSDKRILLGRRSNKPVRHCCRLKKRKSGLPETQTCQLYSVTNP